MKPRGPLMIEHRLIEKMLTIADKELRLIKERQRIDPIFIDIIVDFIRIYADRTHHGKEEDILFKELAAKRLNKEDKKMMQDLVNEHINARKVVGELVEANSKYVNGDTKNIEIVIEKLTYLINFYPEHILKEDKIFFPNTEKYFTSNELDDMLNDFWEFDKRMIHEKYNRLYKTLLKKYE